MDKLAALQVFVASGDAGSLAAGGRATGRSRDGASKLIAQLEADLGVQLFARSTRALDLTEAGAEYLGGVRAVVRDLDDADAAARHRQDQPTGALHVNAPMMFGTLKLAPLVPGFLAAYPAIELNLTLDDKLVELPARDVDLLVRLAETPGSELAAEAMGTVGRALYASPAYLAERDPPRAPRDIRGHACLQYGHLATGSEWVLKGPKGVVDRVQIRGRMTSNNGVVLSHAAAAGAGIAVLPDFVAEPFLAAGTLVRVMEAWSLPDLTLFALMPAQRRRARKLRAFVDFVTAALWMDGVPGVARP